MKYSLFLISFLALQACGALQSEKVRPPGSGPTAASITISYSSFQSQCQTQNGIISSDSTMCLTRTSVTIPSGQTPGTVTIDANAGNGNYLVSTGPAANVDIVQNGRYLSSVNARMLLNQGNGQVSFDVTSTLPSAATATVYHCFDRNMHAANCNDNVVPK